MLIRIPRKWELRERDATPEATYFNRRAILKGLGLGAVSMLSGCGLSVTSNEPPALENTPAPGEMEALPNIQKNDKYAVPERGLNSLAAASSFNNYWEFSEDKTAVREVAKNYPFEPWTLRVDGLVSNPLTFDLDSLRLGFQLEERIYRFRCVEAWAMTVPWVGFPFAKLMERVQVKPEAKFVRFTTIDDRDRMPNINRRSNFPWPYTEGLRIDEAMNELTMLTVGLYSRILPGQNGAPVRLTVPWKYGYKNAKSIVRIEFVADQPATFWNTIWPQAYDFTSNVDPSKPHPGWSQERERLLETGEVRDTMLFNGYGELVSQLYS